MSIVTPIRGKLSPLQVPVIIGDPQDHQQPPYVFIWAQPGTPLAEDLSQTHRDIDERIGITCVEETVLNALNLCEQVTELLHNKPITALGYGQGRIRIVDTQPIKLDRSVKALNNRYPAYGVLTVRLQLPKEN